MSSLSLADLKVGVMLLGEFRRLAVHVGAMQALTHFMELGLLPRPARLVGDSAGAIIAVAMSPMTSTNAKHVHSVVRNLKQSNIFSIPMEKKVSGGLALGASSFPLLNHLEPQMRPPLRLGLHALQVLFGNALGYVIVRRMLDAPSDLSNEPLRDLLTETMDFPAIRRSKTEARIMATDILTGEHVAFSTWESKLTLENLVIELLASAAIPGTFPLQKIGSRWLTDAEVRTNFPIEQLEDMDLVLVLCYSGGLGEQGVPKTGREHQAAMWDIAKARISQHDRERYELRRHKNRSLPEAVFITSDRKVPPLTLASFTEPSLESSICLGYDIVVENERRVMEALRRTLARKRAQA